MMLTLLTYPAAFGLFSASPFCVKTAYMLQHSGQHWQRSDLLDPRQDAASETAGPAHT